MEEKIICPKCGGEMVPGEETHVNEVDDINPYLLGMEICTKCGYAEE